MGLGDPVYLAIADDAIIHRVTAQGVPGTAMPAFAQQAGGLLTDAQIDAIVHGIRTRWAKANVLRDANPPPYAAQGPGDPKRGAAAFGDVMKISLKVRGERIAEARFQTFGCGTAIAASSVTTELITGRTLEEAKKFSNQEVIDALGGLPPEKVHCSMLAEEAVRAALKNYWQRQKPAGA